MIRAVFNNKMFEIIDEYSIKSSNNEVTFNDIKIDFTNCTLADIPYKYQKIEIIEGENEDDILTGKGTIIFTGYLDDINLSEMKLQKEEREMTLTLLSPLKMATVRTVSLIGTYSKEECIRRILQPLIDDGFSIKELNIDNGQITVNFVLETVENAMNNVCSKANVFWFIDEKRGIYVNSIDYLFGKNAVKTITENDDFHANGLINIDPTIENVDYSNIINFKNVRLIYYQNNSSYDTSSDIESGQYPIVSVGKVINKGDVVDFNNPIIIDENTLRNIISEKEQNEDNFDETIYYGMNLWIAEDDYTNVFTVSINKNPNNSNFDEYVISNDVTFSDDGGEEGKIVLQRDSFFSNLITGFKWNGNDNAIITLMSSETALRYTTMKFMYTAEIESLKGVISDSGQIEKTIDFNEKWTTLNQLVNYARSLMTQNSNVVNAVQLEYDINPNLKVGDIIDIQLPSFYTEGSFAVKEINYTYTNEIEQNWKITLKSADLVSTYIDLFRPAETEETEDKIDTVILSEFIEENIKEIHTISINQDNHTLNFNL